MSVRSGPETPAGALAPLRHTAYRAIWLANVGSNFGTMIQTVGAAWLMTSLTHSPAMVALVQSAAALPMMLFALPAGSMADNFDRRRLMLVAQLSMLAVAAATTIIAWQGWMTAPLLLLLTFLLGAGNALNAPAWQASVGEMVPRQHLSSAIALNAIGFNAARSTGPAVGGLIVAIGGATAAFAANAASFLGLIWVLLRWRPETPKRLFPREGLIPAMRAGMQYAIMAPSVRAVLVRGIAFAIASSAIPALMPLVARDQLNGTSVTYGFLLAAFGAGGVGGAFLSAKFRGRASREATIRLASVAFAVATLGAALSPWAGSTMLCLAVAGAAWLIVMSTFNVVIQVNTPRWVVARSLSFYQMIAFAGLAGGSWVWGTVTDHYGLPASLACAAAVMIASLLLAGLFPLPSGEDANLAPLREFSEPQTAIRLEPGAGPIVITIEYRISSANEAEFLAAMTDWRRLRIRDGAKHWSLQRDLQDSESWLERYEAATWLDYLRHNQRFTKADASIANRIQSLDQRSQPRVSRFLKIYK